jgi:hypothetical protein
LPGFLGIGFTTVHVGPGRAIDHGIGSITHDRALNRTSVSDIERLVIVT